MYWIRASAIIYFLIAYGFVFTGKIEQKTISVSSPLIFSAMFIEGMYEEALKKKTKK